jgi:hypothetical protein
MKSVRDSGRSNGHAVIRLIRETSPVTLMETPLDENDMGKNSLLIAVMADAQHFLNGGNSRNCFQSTVFQQSSHAGEASLAA